MTQNLTYAKLPMLQIILSTGQSILALKADLFRALLIPTILLMVFNEFAYHYDMQIREIVSNIWDGNYQSSSWLLLIALQHLLLALFAITCHRIILLGKENILQSRMLKFSKREFVFWAWAFSIYIVLYFIGSFMRLSGLAFELAFMVTTSGSKALDMLPIPITSLLSRETLVVYMGALLLSLPILPLLYIASRFMMIWPAIAVDDDSSFKKSWILTHHNGVRLTIILFFIPNMVLFLFWWLLSKFWEISLITDIFYYILFALEIVLLSKIYQFLRECE